MHCLVKLRFGLETCTLQGSSTEQIGLILIVGVWGERDGGKSSERVVRGRKSNVSGKI